MSSRYLALVRVAFFLAVLAPFQIAYAQSDQEKAAELYKAGIDMYFAEDFGLAITKFQAGYKLDPNPMFLYSLSLCFSKLQNFEQALENAQRARDAGGMQPDVTTKNDARLVSFALLIRSGEILEGIKQDQAKPEGPATCRTNSDCESGEVCNLRRGICLEEFPNSSEPGNPLFSPVGWAGVGAAAVGAGLLVGGGFTSLGVKKNSDRLELVSDPANAEFDAKERDDLAAKIEDQKSLGRILVLSGAGLAVVGVGLVVVDLFVLNKKDKDEATSLFLPMISNDGGGLVWMARF